jgi:hypothetical protein
MKYVKIFFIILIIIFSYLIIDGKFNIKKCKKCIRKKTKKSVSFADDYQKPLETFIKFDKTI